MGRKKVSEQNKKIPITVHSERYKIEKIGSEKLKEIFVEKIDDLYFDKKLKQQ